MYSRCFRHPRVKERSTMTNQDWHWQCFDIKSVMSLADDEIQNFNFSEPYTTIENRLSCLPLYGRKGILWT